MPARLDPARLASFARVHLAHLPTPLEHLPRLSESLGSEVWIKRDDCTGLAAGGNKVRKLEFLMGEALAHDVGTVITVGGVQSNHARQTAAAAARLGLRCQLVLPRVVAGQGERYEETGNPQLDRLLGAELFVVDDEAAAAAQIRALLDAAEARGAKAVVHPAGGSTAVGTLGYVAAALEFAEQSRERALRFDRIYVATSTGGTLAGLELGLGLSGVDGELCGVCVAGTSEKAASDVRALADGVARLLDTGRGARPASLLDGYLGPGYGLPDEATLQAVRRLAREEGILLDPVYTGKAMNALLSRERDAGTRVLFWHTGGLPSLFAYPEL